MGERLAYQNKDRKPAGPANCPVATKSYLPNDRRLIRGIAFRIRSTVDGDVGAKVNAINQETSIISQRSGWQSSLITDEVEEALHQLHQLICEQIRRFVADLFDRLKLTEPELRDAINA